MFDALVVIKKESGVFVIMVVMVSILSLIVQSSPLFGPPIFLKESYAPLGKSLNKKIYKSLLITKIRKFIEIILLLRNIFW